MWLPATAEPDPSGRRAPSSRRAFRRAPSSRRAPSGLPVPYGRPSHRDVSHSGHLSSSPRRSPKKDHRDDEHDSGNDAHPHQGLVQTAWPLSGVVLRSLSGRRWASYVRFRCLSHIIGCPSDESCWRCRLSGQNHPTVMGPQPGSPSFAFPSISIHTISHPGWGGASGELR